MLHKYLQKIKSVATLNVYTYILFVFKFNGSLRMELEKEIQQEKFQNEYQKLLVNILFTHGWLTSLYAKHLKPYGISAQQYNILRILRGQHPNPATINLLRERMLDKMSNASRLVEKLRLKGLVERRECPMDRRAVDVIITQKGLDLLKTLDNVIRTMEDKLKTITEVEAKEVNRILDKLRG